MPLAFFVLLLPVAHQCVSLFALHLLVLYFAISSTSSAFILVLLSFVSLLHLFSFLILFYLMPPAIYFTPHNLDGNIVSFCGYTHFFSSSPCFTCFFLLPPTPSRIVSCCLSFIDTFDLFSWMDACNTRTNKGLRECLYMRMNLCGTRRPFRFLIFA